MFEQIGAAIFRLSFHQRAEPVIVTNKGEPMGTYVPWDSGYAVVKVAQTPRSAESDAGGGNEAASDQTSPSSPAPRPRRRAAPGAKTGVKSPARAYSKSDQTGRAKK